MQKKIAKMRSFALCGNFGGSAQVWKPFASPVAFSGLQNSVQAVGVVHDRIVTIDSGKACKCTFFAHH
jgi:hypothetical protein